MTEEHQQSGFPHMFPEWEFKSKVCKSPSRSVIAGYMCLYLIKSIHYEPSFYLDHTNLVTTRIYSLHQPVIPERGLGPRRNPLCDPYSWVHLSPYLFFLSPPGSSLLIKGTKVHYKSTVWAQLLQAGRVSGRKQHAHKQTPQSCALSLS